MVYFVKLNNQILFKGSFYACKDYIDKVKVNPTRLMLTARK